jgi:hypothetical protein
MVNEGRHPKTFTTPVIENRKPNFRFGVESGYSIKPPECCQRAQKRTFAERAGP